VCALTCLVPCGLLGLPKCTPKVHLLARAQVYALTKERDALRRGAERLTGVGDLVREKDEIIKQARAAPARAAPGGAPPRLGRARARVRARRCVWCCDEAGRTVTRARTGASLT